uniref:CCHC-type domain-containing protein n=1 Tax=Tanacetum cinerariifolium TaxID=118510 RepID=A0A699H874_TANCI|nr:hypothetical protein [Tanacetum cinerariifolium]
MQNTVQYQDIQNVGNQNGLSVVLRIVNQHGNGNVVAAHAEGNSNGINKNQIRCYNCRGEDHYASNYTVKPRKQDTACACEETERDNANCTLENNLQQASTSSTQSDKAPVYETDESAEVHLSKNCYDNDIFNMFTQEEQYTELLEPILEPHQVPQNDNNVISEVSSVEQGGGTVEQHHANVEKTADESFAKNKALELEIEHLLRAVVSQDIMSIVQTNSVVDTSNLQTGLERTKERFENCIFKKENDYAKLWNDWYKKCEECKYDKISYDKAYNDMQQKIKRLQAQLEDQKGKSKDTSCVSDILDPLSQKLKNENVELGFQVQNYEKENAHLKTVYKNLFDSINVTRNQTKTIIDSLHTKLHDTIYKNAALRAQLFDKVSEQKDTTKGVTKRREDRHFDKITELAPIRVVVRVEHHQQPWQPVGRRRKLAERRMVRRG